MLGGRTVRSLLVTPWFAAGAGILIAATLVLESPTNAVLSYGPVTPGALCQNPDCVTSAPKHAPDSLATLKPGVQLNAAGTKHAGTAASALPRGSARPAPAAVTVGFHVVRQGQGGFVAVITVPGSRKLGGWTLGFTIPGARISRVLGAKWQIDASGDGGVADGQPSSWPRYRAAAKTANIVIFGTGTPGQPAACTFDSRSCVFS